MPWCPKCKMEYSDGIITCANCSETVTDSLDNTVNELDRYELGQLEEKATAIRLVKYLNYSGIQNVDIKADSESNCYRILVAQSEKNSAIKHYKAFLEVEEELSLQATAKENSTDESNKDEAQLLAEQDTNTSDEDPSDYDVYVREEGDSSDSDVDTRDDEDSSDSDADIQEDYPSAGYEESDDSEDISDDFEEDFNDLDDFNQENSEDTQYEFEDNQDIEVQSSSGSAYVLKKDAYKEHRSSASMFFAFSIGGLIFLGLNVVGIIQFVNGLFSYLVMGAMFVGFFFLGIYSLRKAKEISTGIDAENELTQKINSYLKALGDISSIDEADWSGLTDEVLYFKRTTKLKQMVQQKFGIQNEAYLDVVIEEFYNETV